MRNITLNLWMEMDKHATLTRKKDGSTKRTNT